jgi:Flp pilus assembly protein TadD
MACLPHVPWRRLFLAPLTAAVWLLAGCSALPLAQPDTARLWVDAAFTPVPTPTRADLFALSPAMQAFVDGRAGQSIRTRRDPADLVRALHARGQLRIEYDAALTRTAAQAYEARAGNCLSLVVMTAAFARAFGLELQFQRVQVDERWRMVGGMVSSSGHVNLRLGHDSSVVRALGHRPEALPLTVDFLPPVDLGRQRSAPIDEDTVAGMFLNNRAVELLGEGQEDAAYWHAREAVRVAPREAAGYNTLGVVYQRRGLDEAARRAWQAALARDPDDVRALANLAGSLRQAGQSAEAARLFERLKALEPVAPFHHYLLGVAALRERRFDEALQHFERERARTPEQPEPHLGLAQAHAALGHVAEARQHLRQARDLSVTRGERALYAAKLERLGEVGTAP